MYNNNCLIPLILSLLFCLFFIEIAYKLLYYWYRYTITTFIQEIGYENNVTYWGKTNANCHLRR